MIKIKLLVLMVALFASQFSFANDASDPCSEIPGKWEGTWAFSGCVWDIVAEGYLYNDIVRFRFDLTSNSRSCIDSAFALTGTCKDSKLQLKSAGGSLEGNVFSGFLNLHDSDYRKEILLHKKY